MSRKISRVAIGVCSRKRNARYCSCAGRCSECNIYRYSVPFAVPIPRSTRRFQFSGCSVDIHHNPVSGQQLTRRRCDGSGYCIPHRACRWCPGKLRNAYGIFDFRRTGCCDRKYSCHIPSPAYANVAVAVGFHPVPSWYLIAPPPAVDVSIHKIYVSAGAVACAL